MSPRLMGILVAVVSLIWASLTIYTEIIDEDPNQYSITSPEVKQLVAQCSGNFQQRQACAERITDRYQQIGFLVWLEKFAIILGPPLILWGLMAYSQRERSRASEPQAPSRRAAAEGGLRAPRRVAAQQYPQGGVRAPTPAEMDGGQDDSPLRPPPNVPDAPIFSGGRREPVRRRDR